jgi:hypothetical protein
MQKAYNKEVEMSTEAQQEQREREEMARSKASSVSFRRVTFEQGWVDSMLRELAYNPRELQRWQRFARS